MSNVLITGGSGMVGQHLSRKLQEKAHQVTILGRTKADDESIQSFEWDVSNLRIDEEAIEMADFIIHLAGANISDQKWTAKRKELIRDSRVKSGQLIYDVIKSKKTTTQAFISASAIGYYGTQTSEKIYVESDEVASDFLGEVCSKWEQSADRFKELGIRTVKIRTGIVLTEKGGALSKMIIPIKLGFGAPIGSGRQYLPWIHIDDLCGIYIKAIEDVQMEGAFNAVAPDHETNAEFTTILAKVLRKRLWSPNVPKFVLRLLFGEMSDILLKGSRVSADKVQSAGYEFLFPKLEAALIDLT